MGSVVLRRLAVARGRPVAGRLLPTAGFRLARHARDPHITTLYAARDRLLGQLGLVADVLAGIGRLDVRPGRLQRIGLSLFSFHAAIVVTEASRNDSDAGVAPNERLSDAHRL